MEATEFMLALRLVAELLKVGRAVFEAVAGRPMTREDLDAAFACADAADADWQETLAAASAAAGKEDPDDAT